MKKSFLFLAFLLVPFLSFCQVSAGQSEFSISRGVESTMQLDQQNVFSLGDGGNSVNSSGSFFLAYKYFVTSRWGIGIEFGQQQIDATYYYFNYLSNSSSLVIPLFTRSFSCSTLALVLQYNYVNHRYFRLYGTLGAGESYAYTRSSPLENSNISGTTYQHGIMGQMQFSPIGVNIGRQFSGFLELGMGYKGMVNMGIAYRLPGFIKHPGN